MGCPRKNDVAKMVLEIINSEQDIKEAKLKIFSNVDQVESPVDKGLRTFIKGIEK
jgi:hypothetical protein